MEQLEALAEARRAEVARSEQAATMSTTSNDITVTRIQARDRAKEMLNYRWKVLENHKTSSNSTVVVPRYVKEATTGTWVTGIPYCWGGFNGYESETGAPSFASLVTSTAYTAGNTGNDVVSSTIGLDCSGYLSSVYDLTSKKDTAGFLSYGHAVTQDQLKPMDFFVRRIGNAGHVSLFEGWNDAGTVLVIYECDVTENVSANVYLNGKTLIEEWGLTFVVGSDGNTYVNNGFMCRSPFHEGACDQNGGYISVLPWDHARTCSVCGHIGTLESHNIRGEMIIDEEDHYWTCSICGMISMSGSHTFEYYGTCDECGYEAYP